MRGRLQACESTDIAAEYFYLIEYADTSPGRQNQLVVALHLMEN
jgi:hypothetical protein